MYSCFLVGKLKILNVDRCIHVLLKIFSKLLKLGQSLAIIRVHLYSRELQTGQGFYVVAPEPEDSFHLFRFPNIPFLGSWVAIYEPQSSGTIHSLPLITTSTTLIPIEVSPDTTEIRLTSIDASPPLDFCQRCRQSRIDPGMQGTIWTFTLLSTNGEVNV